MNWPHWPSPRHPTSPRRGLSLPASLLSPRRSSAPGEKDGGAPSGHTSSSAGLLGGLVSRIRRGKAGAKRPARRINPEGDEARAAAEGALHA